MKHAPETTKQQTTIIVMIVCHQHEFNNDLISGAYTRTFYSSCRYHNFSRPKQRCD